MFTEELKVSGTSTEVFSYFSFLCSSQGVKHLREFTENFGMS